MAVSASTWVRTANNRQRCSANKRDARVGSCLLAFEHESCTIIFKNRIGKRDLQSEPMTLAVLPLSGELLTVANCPQMTRSRRMPDRESLTVANGLNWLLCLSQGVLRNIRQPHSKCPEWVNESTMDPTTGRNRLKDIRREIVWSTLGLRQRGNQPPVPSCITPPPSVRRIHNRRR
jgi:hypothetical protein